MRARVLLLWRGSVLPVQADGGRVVQGVSRPRGKAETPMSDVVVTATVNYTGWGVTQPGRARIQGFGVPTCGHVCLHYGGSRCCLCWKHDLVPALDSVCKVCHLAGGVHDDQDRALVGQPGLC